MKAISIIIPFLNEKEKIEKTQLRAYLSFQISMLKSSLTMIILMMGMIMNLH